MYLNRWRWFHGKYLGAYYDMILQTTLLWLKQNTNHSFNYGMSIVRIPEKIDHVMMAPHCITTHTLGCCGSICWCCRCGRRSSCHRCCNSRRRHCRLSSSRCSRRSCGSCRRRRRRRRRGYIHASRRAGGGRISTWTNKKTDLRALIQHVMTSYQYTTPHCGDMMVIRSSFLHNGMSYTGKWYNSIFILKRTPVCLKFCMSRALSRTLAYKHNPPPTPPLS